MYILTCTYTYDNTYQSLFKINFNQYHEFPYKTHDTKSPQTTTFYK